MASSGFITWDTRCKAPTDSFFVFLKGRTRPFFLTILNNVMFEIYEKSVSWT